MVSKNPECDTLNCNKKAFMEVKPIALVHPKLAKMAKRVMCEKHFVKYCLMIVTEVAPNLANISR